MSKEEYKFYQVTFIPLPHFIFFLFMLNFQIKRLGSVLVSTISNRQRTEPSAGVSDAIPTFLRGLGKSVLSFRL